MREALTTVLPLTEAVPAAPARPKPDGGGLAPYLLVAPMALVFLLFFVAPGDPARVIAGDKATEAQLEQILGQCGRRQCSAEQACDPVVFHARLPRRVR